MSPILLWQLFLFWPWLSFTGCLSELGKAKNSSWYCFYLWWFSNQRWTLLHCHISAASVQSAKLCENVISVNYIANRYRCWYESTLWLSNPAVYSQIQWITFRFLTILRIQFSRWRIVNSFALIPAFHAGLSELYLLQDLNYIIQICQIRTT